MVRNPIPSPDLLKGDMGLPPGYTRLLFPDMKLVLRGEVEPFAGDLRGIIQAILDENPEFQGLKPVKAGRGIVYFGRLTGVGEIAIRAYRHGGMLERVTGGRFFSPKRFFRELAVTEMARTAGVTRLEPVGVAYLETFLGVTGFWVSQRITGAENLHAYMLKFPPTHTVIKKVARTIAEMHRRGIGHADLTIQNILVIRGPGSPLSVSIIDFDKAVSGPLSLKERMRQLRRLDRSLLKWLPKDSAWRRPATRLSFAAAYCERIPEARPLIREYIRRFEGYERRYRWGWSLQNLLKGSTSRR